MRVEENRLDTKHPLSPAIPRVSNSSSQICPSTIASLRSESFFRSMKKTFFSLFDKVKSFFSWIFSFFTRTGKSQPEPSTTPLHLRNLAEEFETNKAKMEPAAFNRWWKGVFESFDPALQKKILEEDIQMRFSPKNKEVAWEEYSVLSKDYVADLGKYLHKGKYQDPRNHLPKLLKRCEPLFKAKN